MEFLFIVAIIAGVWFWLDSLSSRDYALNVSRTVAERMQLQLLDETVACVKIRLKRNHYGKIQMQRDYAFECTASGGERLLCQISLLGKHLTDWYVPPYLQNT